MPDVGELVAEHSAQLALAQELQDAGGCRDRRVFGVAAGGEGVRLRFVYEIDTRHRKICRVCELANRAIELRRRALVDLLCAIEPQHHLVGEPVRPEIDACAEHEREQHAATTAQDQRDDPWHRTPPSSLVLESGSPRRRRGVPMLRPRPALRACDTAIGRASGGSRHCLRTCGSRWRRRCSR